MTKQLLNDITTALESNNKRGLKDIYKSLSERQADEVSKWYDKRVKLLSKLASKAFGENK